MNLTTFLSIAFEWLSFDTLADCLCVLLVFAVFAIARNIFRQTR